MGTLKYTTALLIWSLTVTVVSGCHCTLTGFMKRSCKARQEQQRADGVYKILVALIAMDF